jgi:LysR family glycine cleavage system transcriptional activator
MRVAHEDTREGIRFGSVSLAYQFAREGYGIAIAQHALVVEDLESGALVAPFPERVKIPDAFYLIHSDTTADKHYVVEFRAWLAEEAAAFEAQRQRPR